MENIPKRNRCKYIKSVSSSTMTTQIQLDILLREYASLRQEATHCDSTQMSLATSAFGLLAAFFTFSSFFAKDPANAFLVYCVLPCFSMFFGLLWIDQLYRRTRFGTYLRRIENKANLLLPDLKSDGNSIPVMEFEHWISELDDRKFLFLRPRFVYGFILTGTWIVTPLLVLLSSSFLFPEMKNLIDFYKEHLFIGVTMFLIFFIYYFYLVLLVYRMQSFLKEASLSKAAHSMDY